MMALEVQEAIYYELSHDLLLNAAVTGIYDNVLQEADYPYVVIGDDTIQGWDTDEANGINTTVTIHIWSKYNGKKEVKEIMDLIYRTLHKVRITIAGLHTVACLFEFSETLVDSDGQTRHGVMQFRILAHEEVS